MMCLRSTNRASANEILVSWGSFSWGSGREKKVSESGRILLGKCPCVKTHLMELRILVSRCVDSAVTCHSGGLLLLSSLFLSLQHILFTVSLELFRITSVWTDHSPHPQKIITKWSHITSATHNNWPRKAFLLVRLNTTLTTTSGSVFHDCQSFIMFVLCVTHLVLILSLLFSTKFSALIKTFKHWLWVLGDLSSWTFYFSMFCIEASGGT